MESLAKLRLKMRTLDSKNKLLAVAFIFLGALSLLTSFSGKEVTPKKNGSVPGSVDTYIPPGYVLVPIEVTNAASLGSLLGDVGGVVDLYLPRGRNSIKVASKLKILRAPYNPDLYAVLVKDQDSSRILGFTGPFLAVVQNPKETGQKVVEVRHSNIKIEYQN